MAILSLTTMVELPSGADCNLMQTPAFSPRGDYIAWTCADDISDVSINLQRLSDGKVIQLLRGVNGIGGLAWSEDARRIIYSTGFTGGDLWEVELARPNPPVKLPFGHDATDIAISPAGKKLAFQQAHINTSIWRVDLSQPQARAEKAVASSRQQIAPSGSPDGTRIAFASNRSGSVEIWVSDSDGSNAMQLTSFDTLTGTPHWSPDGKLIVFDSRVGGDANIYLVDPHGGVPKKVNIDVRGNSLPSWSHDGRWIYFVNGEIGLNPSVWKVPVEGGHATQISKHGAWMPRESPDGHYVYFSRNGYIWRVKPDGTEEQQIEGMPEVPGVDDAWYPFGSGIYFLAYKNQKAEIDFIDLDTKKIRTVFVLEKHPPEYVGSIHVSNDGRWLLFPQLDDASSDLMLVENWH
jgi:Tol biopolymer transport system component